MHAAAANGRAPIVESLIDAGADANARKANGMTPLYVPPLAVSPPPLAPPLALRGRLRTSAVRRPDRQDLRLQFALCLGVYRYVAAEKGHAKCIEILLRECKPRDLERGATDWIIQGCSPLFTAATNGSHVLVLAGMDAWAVATSVTDLMAAASDVVHTLKLVCCPLAGHADACELLLHAGARVNATCATGATPLHAAARAGHAAAVGVLIDGNADVLATEHGGATPYTAAAAELHEACCELLACVLAVAVVYACGRARAGRTVMVRFVCAGALNTLALLRILQEAAGGAPPDVAAN